MYSTCLFCTRGLGANEAIEHFPVGRRIAFDAERGRLWAVCRACERWNLSPLEERWEALEECERLFRGTRLRVSTEHVGLARLREGTELVRVGRPQRPEMAAWRYGDQFGRRRRRAIAFTGVGVAAVGAVVAGGWALGVGFGAVGESGNLFSAISTQLQRRKVIARIPDPGGPIVVRHADLRSIRLEPGEWVRDFTMRLQTREDTVRFRGEEAFAAAAALLPAVNHKGGNRRDVAAAVDLLEEAGDPVAAFAAAARTARGRVPLHELDHPVRLALEMAAHEERERRALEGELAELEAAWREAEELAAIADRLTIPASVEAALERLKAMARS